MTITITGTEDKPTVESFEHDIPKTPLHTVQSILLITPSFFIPNSIPLTSSKSPTPHQQPHQYLIPYPTKNKDGDPATGSVTITITGTEDKPTVESFEHDIAEDSGAYSGWQRP